MRQMIEIYTKAKSVHKPCQMTHHVFLQHVFARCFFFASKTCFRLPCFRRAQLSRCLAASLTALLHKTGDKSTHALRWNAPVITILRCPRLFPFLNAGALGIVTLHCMGWGQGSKSHKRARGVCPATNDSSPKEQSSKSLVSHVVSRNQLLSPAPKGKG